MVMFNTDTPVDLVGFRESMKMAGIEEVVDLTIEIFSDEAPKIFDTLRGAAETGDMEGVRNSAHALKSSAGNIWAGRLAKYLETMEGAAAEHDAAQVDSTLTEATPEFNRVMAYLAEARDAP